MLPQKNKLRKMKEWEILFKEGRFVAGKLVNLKIWRVNPAKYPKRDFSDDDLKIGFAVGLKISKSAVKRNRVKRQMREVVRLLLKDKVLRKGFFVGVLAKPEIVGKEYDEIERDIVGVLKKSCILE